MKCSKCQANNPPDSSFCAECGAKLVLQCPKCGQSLEARFKFCNGCGHDLSRLLTPPEPDISPPADRALEGDRRQATVLFSDLSGYTTMNERLDPEEVSAIMGRIKAEAVKIVESHGGIVNQFVGDEVMALFGIPTAHKDDPARAARVGLALHAMVRAMSPQVEPRLGRALRLHTGINTGLIVTSKSDDRDGRVGVTGDAINVGARLKALAEDDVILLGQETHNLVLDEFETEPMDPVLMKGKAEQVAVFRLVAERSAPVSISQPFVGRRTEIRQFTGIVDGCLESGRGQAVYLRADAGVGKSRLAEEFQSIAIAHGFACHKGLVLDFGTAKGHDAIRRVVVSLMNISVGASEKIQQEAIGRAVVGGVVGEAQIIYLNDLLDLPQPAHLRPIYDAMDNEIRNRGKRDTVCQLVRRASANQPVMIRIEDLHWADATTLAHLSALAATVAEVRALLVMTSRLEGDPLNQEWRAASQSSPLTTFDLTPLRADEALDLAKQFLDVSAQFAQRCVERAGGNPLFLVQLLRTAEESSGDSIPGSVQSLVLARVDRLPEEDRRAIQTASIFGQSFALDALRAVLRDLQYRCDKLAAHLLVRPEGDGYLFAHALIQEGVYGSLLIARRNELHQRAAEWFAGRDLPLRAEHLGRAKDPAAAQAFLEAARNQAAEFRQERALALAERGMELEAGSAVQFALKCCAGELLRKLGRSGESVEAYREAERLAGDDIQRCRAWIGQAEGLRLIDQYPDALAQLDKAAQPATEHRLTLELAQIHYLRGNLYFPLGDIDGCLREHGTALNWAREAGSPEAEARALSGLGDAHYLKGRMRTAHDSFRRCVDLCREHGLGQVEVPNLSMIGWCAIYIDTLGQALETAMAAAEIARRGSHHRAESQARGLAGFIGTEMGEFSEAKEQLNLALALSRKLKARRFESHFLGDLGKLADAQGNPSGAMELTEQALQICRETGMSYLGPTILACYARLAGDPETRRCALEEGERILQKGCVSHNYFWFYRDAMEASLSAGDWQSVSRYAAALEEYTRPDPTPWSEFFILRGRTLAAHGQGQRDDSQYAKLVALSGEAERMGLKIAARSIDDALRLIRP